MEALKIALSLLMLLLVIKPSRSQTCGTNDGSPNCQAPASPPWRSNVRRVGPVPPPVTEVGMDGNGEFTIRWDPDTTARPDEDLVVIVRPFEDEVTIAVPPIQVLSGTTEVTIEELDIGVQYVATVCYVEVLDVTPPEVPGFDESSEVCGFCDTCFIAQPSTTTGTPPGMDMLPEIVMAVRTQFEGGNIRASFSCEARGRPRPSISWQASDTNTDQIVTLMNNSPGIAIRMNMVGNGGILSELDIFHSADFNRPSCIASNAAGEVTVSVFERVTATAGTPMGMDMPLEIVMAVRTQFEGGNIRATFSCEARGRPRPSISWQALNTTISQNVTLVNDTPDVTIRMNQIGNDGILSELDIFRMADFNMPSCIASNSAGVVAVSEFETVTATADPGLPEITEATRQIFSEGEFSDVFYCEAVARPRPMITWRAVRLENNEDVPLMDGDEGVTIDTSGSGDETSSTLRVPRDSPIINNGVVCAVNNGGPEETVGPGQFTRINIDGSSDGNPPIIVESTVINFRGSQGISFHYACEAVGDPLPTITWVTFSEEDDAQVTLFNGIPGIQIVEEEEPPEITSELTVFREADFSAFSDLMCVAENVFGEDRTGEFIEEETGTPPTGPPEPQPGVAFPTYAAIIIGAGVPALVVLILLIVCLCVWRKRSRQSTMLKNSKKAVLMTPEPELRSVEGPGTMSRPSNTYREPLSPTSPVETSFAKKHSRRKNSLISKLPPDMIVSPDVLQVSTIIGQGEFGVVYKGYLKTFDVMDTVAIKTLKGIFITAQDIENASAEILKMSKFDHPNVMRLVGVCLAPSGYNGGAGPCIVMPFMAKGSLLDFLRKHSDTLILESDEDPPFMEVRTHLLQMSLQVAKGMEYLASLKFIHRDLAARNCLIDANNIIKISDFGLAEDIYSQNYFRQVQGGIKLPLKWMALESVKLGVFTEKTDVWSFGVTCWEIFNGGGIPYPGIHPQNILNYLEDGNRLEKPRNTACCDTMYKLMLSMWSRKTEDRPNFASIVVTLTDYLITTSDYLDLTAIEKASLKKSLPNSEVDFDSDPEHCITRVPAKSNDYTKAGPGVPS